MPRSVRMTAMKVQLHLVLNLPDFLSPSVKRLKTWRIQAWSILSSRPTLFRPLWFVRLKISATVLKSDDLRLRLHREEKRFSLRRYRRVWNGNTNLKRSIWKDAKRERAVQRIRRGNEAVYKETAREDGKASTPWIEASLPLLSKRRLKIRSLDREIRCWG